MYKKIFCAIFIFIITFYTVSYAGMPVEKDINDLSYADFQAEYVFEFSGMKVAHGTLSGRKQGNIYTIVFDGRVTKLISLIYKLKEHIEGSVDVLNYAALDYKYHQTTSKKNKFVDIKFIDEHKADVSINKNDERKHYSVASKYSIFSPVSLYILFMNDDAKIEKEYYKYVVIDHNLYMVDIKNLGQTTINLDKLERKKGLRRVIKVEFRFNKLDKNGILKKNNKVKKLDVWISCRNPKIPVLIKSQHILGMFSARLQSIKIGFSDIIMDKDLSLRNKKD